ncbi:MAG: dTMP kinase [Burkholderiaceae bacterium]
MTDAAPSRGRFITFEGIDGAGKSTHIDASAEVLGARGVRLMLTREPGGTPLGEALRELVLHHAMTPDTETLLMFAARAEHLVKVIRPALAAGQWVLCDRFTDATYAYQAGGRGMPKQRIEQLEKWVHPDLKPDLTILFDVAPDVAAQRVVHRREASSHADRFEVEPLSFFEAVRAMYLKLARADPARFFVIDSQRAPESVHGQLVQFMREWNG